MTVNSTHTNQSKCENLEKEMREIYLEKFHFLSENQNLLHSPLLFVCIDNHIPYDLVHLYSDYYLGANVLKGQFYHCILAFPSSFSFAAEEVWCKLC